MNNSIKLALIVLYAMQLMLMFREAAVHAYRSAVEHGETERDRIVKAVAGLQHFIVKAAIPTFDPHESLQAARHDSLAFLLFGFGVVDDDGGDIEEDARKDQKEDRRKKGRRRVPGERLVINLYQLIKTFAPPPGHDVAHLPVPLRALTFAAS